MRIFELQSGALHVSRRGDTFYNRPLPEITLFRMELDRAEVEPHTGAFSLKTILGGSERYDFTRRSVCVRPGQTLLVNEGETYSSEIDRPSHSLAIFYRKVDVASAARSVSAAPGTLLDRPLDDGAPPEVAQIVLDASPLLKRRLNDLVLILNDRDADAAEDAARAVLAAALRQSLALAPPPVLGGIVKRSTRDELLSRVLRARSAIHDGKGRHCSLDDLAALACLSKYHFLRVFSEAFGETPSAMARRLRLEAAAESLERGEPLPSVVRRAGYRDIAAFRRALHRIKSPTGL